MADVFEEPTNELSDEYVASILGRPETWVISAIEDGLPVGGVIAHAIPMTREPIRELFVYDVAVHSDHQRRGVGGAMMRFLGKAAAEEAIRIMFVAADDDDRHAIEFYRALGGTPMRATFFTFVR